MKRLFLLVSLLLIGHVAVGQTSPEPAATDTYTQQQVEAEPIAQQPHAARPIPPQPVPAATPGQPPRAPTSDRYRYDPGARVDDGDIRTSKESNLERGLKSINKDNINYGGLLAVWRIALVEETIESLYFWGLLLFCGALILESAYIAWLVHERENRLQITGTMVAELWNLYVFARSKALDAITAHNKLVSEIDAQTPTQPSQTAQTSSPELIAADTPLDATEVVSAETPQLADTPSGIAVSGDIPRELFQRKPAPSTTDEAGDSASSTAQHEAVPLSVKIARGTWARQDQPDSPTTLPESKPATAESPKAAPVPEKEPAATARQDLDQIKLALQKALEEGAKKDAMITRQGVQLNAKDAILSSNRSLITELNNKLKGNSVTGNVAK